MRTDYFVTLTNISSNDGNTFGPYISKDECKNFIQNHNKLIFKSPKVIYVSDSIITYKENDLKIRYEIFTKTVS